MTPRRPLPFRAAAFLACCVLGLAVVACDGSRTDRSPTAPALPIPPTSLPPTNPPTTTPDGTVYELLADAVVLSSVGSGPRCGWGTRAGQTRVGVLWQVTVDRQSISLYEDMQNAPTDGIPFTGRFDGRTFEAGYQSSPDYAAYQCQFREASLTGTFSADSFEAHEVLIWGPPENETRVERSWRLHR